MAVMLGGAMVAMVSRIQAWQTKYTYITPSYIETLLQQQKSIYTYTLYILICILYTDNKNGRQTAFPRENSLVCKAAKMRPRTGLGAPHQKCWLSKMD